LDYTNKKRWITSYFTEYGKCSHASPEAHKGLTDPSFFSTLRYNLYMEFHVSFKARKKYQFEDSLFSFDGSVIFANFHAARVFAQRINDKRDLTAAPDLTARAGQVNAMGLIDEILHYVISLYRTQKAPRLYQDLEATLQEKLGKGKLKALLRAFTRDFPPIVVYQGKMTIDEYLAQETDGVPNRFSSFEEILMLWVTNQNLACSPYRELFDDRALAEKTLYPLFMTTLQEFFESQPVFGPDNQNLVDMLRSPAIAVPDSLHGQLEYIRSRWGDLLGHYLLKLLGSLNLFAEEEQLRGMGPGPLRIPVYARGGELEPERFSPDADWMPRLVMMAKNIYVWLDQLGKRYQRPITRLDQVPDEELDRLAEWGFTGLWLIGLWERSRASARIKQACGNPEAIASAYSLKEYRIAADLGGEEALQDLRVRCQQRGIRLASDMVPNHMAVDSTWVIEHPDWFVSLPFSPFPSYTFNGMNLSEDGRGEIYIEDHYYDRSDAAVVFKYVERGKERTYYMYHGNDGTSMPWNDTAQLNYLDPNVREAVIRTILDVARRFPIIRFDAAMTLAKRHYQRLWFPLPGSGCDIPSRSDFSLSQETFNQYMPQEFWREVVDRVAAEAPDTLLLAEAFWLMEGYFVRTLGMHRVYNSAFMNLLRDEENAKYRQVMKNTLEFDPEILKRFVNFMNNPDEQTAAMQFGKGDKYFGICTLMATMPGLPMFGHGQIEGFTEKYGMEYKRAYWDEQSDQGLMDRHAWQIFPLLKKRSLFANVERFYLYDFYDSEGMVDENVFAYSNRAGEERSLVVYHNRFGDTAGWVRTSASFMDKQKGIVQQVDLRTGLDLPGGRHTFVIFRDALSGLQYIRNCGEVARQGLYVQLDAYRAHVFLDFQIVEEDEKGSWQQVHDALNGRGIADMKALQWQLPLRPVLKPLGEILNGSYFHYLVEQRPRVYTEIVPEPFLNEAVHKLENLIRGAAELLGRELDCTKPCAEFRSKLIALFYVEWLDALRPDLALPELRELSNHLRLHTSPYTWLAAIGWLFMEGLRSALSMDVERFGSLLDEWRVFPLIEETLQKAGFLKEMDGDIRASLLFMNSIEGWLKKSSRTSPGTSMGSLLMDPKVREFLKVNDYKGKTWFNQERAETAFLWMAFEGAMEVLQRSKPTAKQTQRQLERLSTLIMQFQNTAEACGYELQRFQELLDQ
jgi:glycosidase